MTFTEMLKCLRGCDGVFVQGKLRRCGDLNLYVCFGYRENHVCFGTEPYGNANLTNPSIDELLSDQWEIESPGIEFIDRSRYSAILESHDANRPELFDYKGKYIHIDLLHGIFIAMDNSDGEGFVEVFHQLADAIWYLTGDKPEPVEEEEEPND